MQVETSHSLLERLGGRSSTGDWETFENIYQPFIKQHLIRHHIPANDADDICQETLTEVFKAISGFRHNGRDGAFRNWLKKIVRQKIWQQARKIGGAAKPSSMLVDDQALDQTFEEKWDREHDQYVVNKLLQLVKTEFTDTSWNSFRRLVIDGEDPSLVAAAMSVTVNSVLISKSRIMKRLREFGKGLVDQF